MSYYRRGKTSLHDDTYEDMLRILDEKISKFPPEEQAKAAQEVLKSFGKKLPIVIEEMKEDIIKLSRKDVERAIKWEERARKDFEKRLYDSHKELIDKYIELLGICLEAVEGHREDTYRALGEKDAVWPLMLRLHARTYRIANEVLSLVRSGYGTGALARWRAMHELVVVMAYIREKGPKAAKVFEDHGAISNYKAIKEYQAYHGRLGQESLDSYEVNLAKRKYDRRLARYGKGFKNDYGWAWYVSGGSIGNFRDLEKYVGIDHLRPYYKLASYGIHSEWSSLVTGEEFHALNEPGVALVGPADYGFEDAVSLSLLTIAHSTMLILTYNLSLTSIVYAKVILETERTAQAILERIAEHKESSLG